MKKLIILLAVVSGVALGALVVCTRVVPVLNSPKVPAQAPAPVDAAAQARNIVEQGWAMEQKGELDTAFRLYEEALKVDPRCAVAYKHRGTVLTRRGALALAIPEFDKAIELDPSHASSYYNRGNLYYSLKNFDHSIADFSKALELNPNYTNPLLNRAAAYIDKNELQKAIEDYSRYLQLLPDDKRIYQARGLLHSQLRHYDEAIADFTKVMEFDPKSGEIYQTRAMLYLFKKEYDPAIADLTKMIELDPAKPGGYNTRAMVNFEKGDLDLALADYNRAIELDPNYMNAYFNRAGVYMEKAEYERAWEDVEIFRKMGGWAVPAFIKELEQKSGRRSSIKDESSAENNPATPLIPQDYLERIKREPKNFEAYLSAANYCAGKGMGKQAAEYAERAIRLNAKDAGKRGAYETLAMAYYFAGNVKKSYEATKRALKSDPDNVAAKEFQKMLDFAIKNYFNGEVPEKVSFGGHDSAFALGEELKRQAFGRLGALGENDSLILPSGTLLISPPLGWEKEANVLYAGYGKALLRYLKSSGNEIPSMAVTKDDAPANIKSALEYSRWVRDFMLKKKSKGEASQVAEPIEETINGRPAAYMEFRGTGLHGIKHRFAWYQFYSEGVVVTFQYANTDFQFQEDFPMFKSVVESMHLEGEPESPADTPDAGKE